MSKKLQLALVSKREHEDSAVFGYISTNDLSLSHYHKSNGALSRIRLMEVN